MFTVRRLQLSRSRGVATLIATIALALLLVPSLARPSDSVGLRRQIVELESVGRAKPREANASLERLLASTQQPSAERLELLTVQGIMLGTVADPAGTDAAASKLEAWGKGTQTSLARNAKAAALLLRGWYLVRSGRLPAGVAQIDSALQLLPEDGPAGERYRFVALAAFANRQAGNLDTAVRLGHEALTLADHTDEPWRQAETRSQLAQSYMYAELIDRAAAIAEEAVALSEKSRDALSMARAYIMAGRVMSGKGDLAEQGRYYSLAATQARRAGSKTDEIISLGNMADVFLKRSEFSKALAISERILPLAREVGDRTSESLALFNIGVSYIALHQVDRGKRYCQESLALDTRQGLTQSVSESQHELGTYLERVGDLQAALAAYRAHRRFANAIMGSEQQEAILASQEQYDAERRALILDGLDKEKELSTRRLQQSSRRQRLWWLLSACLAVSATAITLLYRRVRLNNRRLEHSNKLLQTQGEQDPLTGLANRRYFDAAMRRLAAEGNFSGTVYLVDIDHFKRINDTHGHSVGDAVLVEVARRLQASVREHDLIVRWGGEEFLIVVQSLEREYIERVAKRVLGALNEVPITIESRHLPVSASIGYSSFATQLARSGVPYERAIEFADAAMYLAKRHGRDRAYGVTLSDSAAETEFEAVASSLENAQCTGQVVLTPVPGRAVQRLVT